jgi:hypothetical protein
MIRTVTITNASRITDLNFRMPATRPVMTLPDTGTSSRRGGGWLIAASAGTALLLAVALAGAVRARTRP